MSEKNTHPQYEESAPDWKAIRLVQKGERHVRNAGELLLPKTSGMKVKVVKDDIENKDVVISNGADQYNAYKSRARLYPVVDDFTAGVIGLAFEKPTECDLSPDGAQTVVTNSGLIVDEMAQRVVEDTSLVGRHILVNDKDEEGNHFIAQYTAESLVNWVETDNKLSWVRLLEVYDKNNDPRNRDMQERYREYLLTNEGVEVTVLDSDDKIISRVTLSTPLDERNQFYFPVTIIGSRHNRPDVDKMPALKIVEAALSAYRLSADQRQGMYAHNQATPWATGVSRAEASNHMEMGSGAGSYWTAHEPNAKFGYLETTGAGIDSTTKEIQAELELADKYAVRVSESSGVEAAKSIEIRTQAQRATVWTIFNMASKGISRALTIYHKSKNANTGNVNFKLNIDFTARHAEAAMLTALSSSVMGEIFPKSIAQNYALKTGLTELTPEEQEREIKTTETRGN